MRYLEDVILHNIPHEDIAQKMSRAICSYKQGSTEEHINFLDGQCCPCCTKEIKEALRNEEPIDKNVEEINQLFQNILGSSYPIHSNNIRNLINCLTAQSLNNQKEIQQELEDLSKSWGGYKVIKSSLSGTAMGICVSTPEIILEDNTGRKLNLGKMVIGLNIHEQLQNGRCKSVQIYSEEPVYPRDDSDYFHPHVTGNLLCLGEATPLVIAALTDCRLTDYFDLVYAALRTYNSDSPYIDIETWLGYLCSGCKEEGEGFHHCEDCDAYYCSYCMSAPCRNCDYQRCADCSEEMVECEDCGDTNCKECCTYCEECQEKYFCRRHYIYTCAECSEKIKAAKDSEEEVPQIFDNTPAVTSASPENSPGVVVNMQETIQEIVRQSTFNTEGVAEVPGVYANEIAATASQLMPVIPVPDTARDAMFYVADTVSVTEDNLQTTPEETVEAIEGDLVESSSTEEDDGLPF
jgi:hypothetical protein